MEMITLLPCKDFLDTARVLDLKSLGEQRVKVLQLLRSLAGKQASFNVHPAAMMWKGHELALIRYGIVVCEEWRRRGKSDHVQEKLIDFIPEFRHTKNAVPSWFQDDEVFSSHRAYLKHKFPHLYESTKWDEAPEADVFWPQP